MASQPAITNPIEPALRALGIERFVLAIHDVSFPSAPGEDIGRGSPYAKGGRDFAAFARELGFDGLQLGPQGQTSAGNRSPYDGSVFSKSVLSIAWSELAEPRFARLLPKGALAESGAARPLAPVSESGHVRADYTHAFEVSMRALASAGAALRSRAARGEPEAVALRSACAAFAAAAPWLAHDARFEAFAALHGTDDWRLWPEGDHHPDPTRIAEVERAQAAVIEDWALGQLILARQHASLREELGAIGMKLYGDMQVGLSLRDRWSRGHLFLPGYAMGAPPSRTNPEGQPWGYPVFDPRLTLRRFVGDAPPADGPLAFVAARVKKLFSELDGVRVDHPHGLVCPWVYEAASPDPMEAVVHGARLFETPRSTEHPALQAFALVRSDQIDASVPAYDDDHVRGLEPAQAVEYDAFFGVIMEAARDAGRGEGDVLCEVLSTCPEPLAAVMSRHALGRFRVTQKASLVDPTDGYRGENAAAGDWIMIGNHDTPPLRAVIERWQGTGTLEARAAYLASRLEPDPSRRAAFASSLSADPQRLAAAMFAELFVGPATNVMVFFADLFGERDVYNTPGLVSDANWSMRVPDDFRAVYSDRCARGEALHVPRALALAMRARGPAFVALHTDLLAALESA